MPSGKTHDFLTLIFAPLFGAGVYFVYKDITLTILVIVGFLFGGLMFSGDLDIKSRVYKRWGIFKFIWIPYRKMVSHRSPLSHNIVTGTLFRLAYVTFILFLFFALIVIIGNYVGGKGWEDLIKTGSNQTFNFLSKQSPLYIAGLFIGIWAGCALHTISDITVSIFKKIV